MKINPCKCGRKPNYFYRRRGYLFTRHFFECCRIITPMAHDKQAAADEWNKMNPAHNPKEPSE